MKKFLSRNRALLLALASLLALMTSCTTEVDNPVIPPPDPVITETLTGEWFATVNCHDYNEDSDEDEIEYVLFSFDEDGVVTQDVYIGSKTSPLKYWERMHRHGIYNVDESAHSITVENIYDNPSVITYGFDKEQLILVYCRSGRRSKEASQKLADRGYLNVAEFGGIIDWPGEVVKD